MTDETLQRFEQFKLTFVSSNLPNNVLLELIDTYIKSDGEGVNANTKDILEGQLSLFDSVS